jgi:hypothetical protein
MIVREYINPKAIQILYPDLYRAEVKAVNELLAALPVELAEAIVAEAKAYLK